MTTSYCLLGIIFAVLLLLLIPMIPQLLNNQSLNNQQENQRGGASGAFPDGYFRIRNRDNNKAIAIDSESQYVKLVDPSDKFDQQWSFKDGKIVSRGNFDVLSLENNLAVDGVKVIHVSQDAQSTTSATSAQGSTTQPATSAQGSTTSSQGSAQEGISITTITALNSIKNKIVNTFETIGAGSITSWTVDGQGNIKNSGNNGYLSTQSDQTLVISMKTPMQWYFEVVTDDSIKQLLAEILKEQKKLAQQEQTEIKQQKTEQKEIKQEQKEIKQESIKLDDIANMLKTGAPVSNSVVSATTSFIKSLNAQPKPLTTSGQQVSCEIEPIENHPDYKKYILRKKCLENCKKCTENTHSKLEKCKKELDECKNEFILPNGQTLIELSGGIAPHSQELVFLDASRHEAFVDYSGKYDIRHHKEFPKLINDVNSKTILKSQCAVPVSQISNYIPKNQLYTQYKNMPIEQHPSYNTIMAKYAVKVPGTWPPQYIPSAELQQKLQNCENRKNDCSKHFF